MESSSSPDSCLPADLAEANVQREQLFFPYYFDETQLILVTDVWLAGAFGGAYLYAGLISDIILDVSEVKTRIPAWSKHGIGGLQLSRPISVLLTFDLTENGLGLKWQGDRRQPPVLFRVLQSLMLGLALFFVS